MSRKEKNGKEDSITLCDLSNLTRMKPKFHAYFKSEFSLFFRFAVAVSPLPPLFFSFFPFFVHLSFLLCMYLGQKEEEEKEENRDERKNVTT